MFTARKKIAKEKNAEPDVFEEQVAQVSDVTHCATLSSNIAFAMQSWRSPGLGRCSPIAGADVCWLGSHCAGPVSWGAGPLLEPISPLQPGFHLQPFSFCFRPVSHDSAHCHVGRLPASTQRIIRAVQALFDLEATNAELKSDLRDLYITAATEVDAGAGRKAIIIHVSFMTHFTARVQIQFGDVQLFSAFALMC